jgi:hypothetical protein
MARYLVQSQHTPAECLNGLDQVLAQGEGTLATYDFACAVGDHSNHICYTSIEAGSADEARGKLPSGIRSQAMVTEVGKFTAAQIRSFHGQS